jgi:hypothetical protein
MKLGDEPGASGGAWSSATTPRWAKGESLPDWLALREGTAPIVIVAPHGGRRQRPIRRGDSVNDLETAPIAWELASRLDAHAIVNHGLDRNEIDLNRITHLVSRAPAVLSLLSSAIAAASHGGRVPLVLFVHGWNMVVPCCDVGIGLRRRAGQITGRFPTLSRVRFDTTVAAIEEELAHRGVSSAVGRRYTASGRDNAVQLFSGRHVEHDHEAVAALARLSIEERVDAAQLELGIPLRWKGPLREALVDALVAALGRPADASSVAGVATGAPVAESGGPVPRTMSGWNLESRARDQDAGPAEPAYSLQAVLDPVSGLATFCGVESTGPHSMAARFSLVFTDGSMMLLVGEGEWNGEPGRYQLEGFEWHAAADGTRTEIRLSAPMIRYTTHDAYLDLEHGLAGSELVDADVSLVAETTAAERAHLRGTVKTLGRTWEVDTVAFLDRAGRRMSAPEGRLRVLAARGDAGTVVAVSRKGAEDASLEWEDRGLGLIRSLPATSNEAVLLEAEVLARVPVWRPAGQGTFVRWQFGIARCRYFDGGPDSIGLFECTDVFTLPAPASSSTPAVGSEEDAEA